MWELRSLFTHLSNKTHATLMKLCIPYLHRCKSVRTRSWWERYSGRQRWGPSWPRTRNVWCSRGGHPWRQSRGGRASEHWWHGRHWRTREPPRWHRWWRGCVGWRCAKWNRRRRRWHSTPAHSVRGLWGWLLARHAATAAARTRNEGWDESTCGCRQSGRHH